ncbi:MAG: gluconolactonase [Candidatus Bathyarchaeota archaeon B26-2]|nr:MAG: gluconolactonase [Candidatus Bathyarchaeota archaeon B26-2]
MLDESKLERIATGFKFTEGPVWNASEDFLLFSDIPANRIYKWPGNGEVDVFREPSGNSNGLTYDKEGRLIICEHGNRRLSRIELDGTYTILADGFRGKRLNSPNDVVVKSDGTIYFTDPPYGIRPEEQELPFQGVFHLDPDSGELNLVVADFDRPNGLAFSPDEETLYIADSSSRRHVRAFDVRPDGALSGGRVFAEIRSELPGNPDGMKVDVEGNLYVAAAGGVWIFSEDGDHLGVIRTPETPANCAWGGEDWRTLFITARASLYRIRLGIPGVKVP